MNYKPSYYLKKIRNYRKRKLVFLKGGKCQVCDYNKCIQALEFHHRDKATKLFNLSGINLTKKSWQEILIEVEKCDLLCSNCHAERENSPTVTENESENA